jgi:hypothetical protein
VTPVHLAAFLFTLPLIFMGSAAFGYGLGLVQAIRGHSNRNYRLSGGGDAHLRAEEKSADLLRSWLNPEQAELWDCHRHFYVIGSDTGKSYRIKYGRAMNIEELDSGGNVVNQWCFGPQGNLAVGDVMLAQKIALETIEVEALAKANRNRTFGVAQNYPACAAARIVGDHGT